jgi:hypothetical protein
VIISNAACERGADNVRAVASAALSGAGRALRGHPAHLVHDAAAQAVLAVLEAVAAGCPIRSPAALARSAARNAGVDMRRRWTRTTLYSDSECLRGSAVEDTCPFGCRPVELRLQLADALALGVREQATAPTRQLALTLDALRHLLAGDPLPDLPPTAERCRRRGTARLAALVAAAN